MYTLKTIIGIDGTPQQCAIKDNGNGSFTSFTFDPDNTDYQAYLKWLAEGNQPLPAENV